jgi:putative membrane protein
MYGYGHGWNMMGYWGSSGFGPFGIIIWLLVLAAIVVGIIWLVRTVRVPGEQTVAAQRSSGLDMLEQRYARGEIARDEYLEKKRDILG